MPGGLRADERTVLVTAALSAMLLPLNSTMIAVALPDVADDLGVRPGSTAWLVTGYLIAQAALQPLAGKLGDRFGRRPLILSGLAAFAAASLGAALAPGLGWLIAARTLQAVAGAMVFPNALALVREGLPERRRGTAFGLLGSAIGLAAAAGPPLGGALVGVGGWRAVFLVNLPWVAAAALLAARAVPVGIVGGNRRPFDAIGAIALSALLAAAAWLLHPGDLPPWVVAVGTASLVPLIAVFLRFEGRQEDPVLQPAFLRVRAFAAATAAVGLSNVALYGTLLAVPPLLAGRPGWSPPEVGIALLAMSGPMMALSPLGGRLADRAGRRAAAFGGLAVLTAGLVPLAIAGTDVAVALLVPSLAMVGAGMGLSNAAVQAAGVEALDARHAGVASGIFSMGRYVGGIAAASLVATVAAGGDDRYGLLFATEAAAAALAALIALLLPGRQPAQVVGEVEVRTTA